ncbi:response regulator transcription factor [Orrella sp. NBD-18]|uniref:Response regulator transcription factor n=1 Tax=Sheuella amnicola TaxID=2707330 RepID=A0A6B2QYQ3_9BURK|nr:response regulator transcription factor [Sheuella amnicola]NDY83151.1 response regulator transcription factor [Sheuella amnicola]HBI83191.1 DNA-binding response regulator [Alcaligenaceae bacterium]
MRILLVEDEPTLSEQIAQSLHEAGYAVDRSDNGRDAAYMGESEPYDAIILDLGLPLIDGLTVLKQWRSKGIAIPVLILTARDGWHEKVSGIDAGADDYLSKPFHMEELLARIRALIRRATGNASSTLQCGPILLDTRSARVTVDGHPVTLTAHEFKVLSYLMHHRDQVVSRTDLTEHIYAQDFDRDSNTIEVFVGRLRKKIPGDLIETIRGLGYRLNSPS